MKMSLDIGIENIHIMGDYIDAEDIEAIIRGFEATISTSKEIEADGGEGVMNSHWHKNDY